MAVYKYRCGCGDREVGESWQESEARVSEGCAECGESVKRVMSLGSFKLSGSGWEKDGYR